MPFHSTATEDEAEALVTLHCRWRRFEGKGAGRYEYAIRVDWPEDDIEAAMVSARRKFKLRKGR